jgi:hypothetical protein
VATAEEGRPESVGSRMADKAWAVSGRVACDAVSAASVTSRNSCSALLLMGHGCSRATLVKICAQVARHNRPGGKMVVAVSYEAEASRHEEGPVRAA